MGTYRDYLTRLVPPWLQRAVGELFLGEHGDALDDLATKAKDATEAAFVASCATDALPYHGLARMLPRWPAESESAHRARLLAAWDTWATAGTSDGPLEEGGTYGLAGMLRAALPGVTVQIRPYRYPYTGPLARGYWSEFWVVLSGTSWTPRVWGTGTWGPEATWGSSATHAEVEAVKGILRAFKAAHEWCPAIVVVFEGRTWGDGSEWGDPGVVWDADANAIYWPIDRS